jgi:hypothetical protein
MEASCGDAGAAVTLAPLLTEAGFIAVPPQPTAATYAAQMFYDFQPADTDPESKPLFVLFNGGPGWPTSSQLLVRGTGRMTLPVPNPVNMRPEPDGGGAWIPVPNPSSWTRFGNLLYLDERLAGFSYGIQPAVNCAMSPVEDASDFVRALLTFLDSHAALRGSQVVLVGESYGGVRASWMLDMLLRYPTEAAMGGSDLPGLIQAHYDAVFPCNGGGAIDESTAARQFGRQVLIEPLVLGPGQDAEQDLLMPDDPYVGSFNQCDMDPEDVLKPAGWGDSLFIEGMEALSDPSAARSLLGVDLDAITLLGPSARASAFHRSPQYEPPPPPMDAGPLDAPDAAPPQGMFCASFPPDPMPDAVMAINAQFAALLGPLTARDAYYEFPGNQCYYQNGPGDTSQPFIANLRYVQTFITHARYDAVIYTPAIPALLGISWVRQHSGSRSTTGCCAAWLVQRRPAGERRSASIDRGGPLPDV